MKEEKRTHGCFPMTCLEGLVLLIILGILFIAAVTSIPYVRITHARESIAIQQVHNLTLACYDYTNINQDKFPSGASATEAFQKLYDHGYLRDPSAIFLNNYRPSLIPYSGSTEKIILKPENIAWDITSPLDLESKEKIPLVFSTGWKVGYVPHALATQVPEKNRTWAQWSYETLWGKNEYQTGMVVAYGDLSAQWLRPEANGHIAHFVPNDFDPHGQTFHQLTPTGELP